MVKRMYKKGLVVGIIVLFICVGFQSAFAVENRVSSYNMEKAEDCDCEEVGEIDLDRLDKAINRIESYTKILSLYSKHNPEYEEIIEEINSRISILKGKIQDIKDYGYYTPYCILYFILFITIWPFNNLLGSIMESNPDTLLYDILYPFWAISFLSALGFWALAKIYYCLWANFFNPYPDDSINNPLNLIINNQ